MVPATVVVVCVAVEALPVNAAVMVPAEKFPEASRATIADAVLAFVAVVAELETFDAVEMVANLVSTIAADALISALTMVPSVIIVLVTVPVSPVVTTVPVTAGKVRVVVPAAAVASTVVVPLEDPLNPSPAPPIDLFVNVKVFDAVPIVTPSMVTIPAPERARVVSVA